MKRRARYATAKERVARRDIDLDDLKRLVERAKAALSDEDHATLAAAVDTLAFLTQELAAGGEPGTTAALPVRQQQYREDQQDFRQGAARG
jgi:hypothetical protein